MSNLRSYDKKKFLSFNSRCRRSKISQFTNMSLLKNIVRAGLRAQTLRNFSAASSDGLVNVKVDDKSGVCTVIMNRPPVNSLNYELLQALYTTFSDLERNKCRGMILTSSSPKVFSAGLDIMEMYKPSQDRAQKFWTMLQDAWIKLYSSPYPTVAAINGHAPAGGCLLALSCEHRIIVPNVTIGLNETQLGIVAPSWFQDCMRNVIGERQAEKALITGRMFTSDEALKLGMVDEIATDANDLAKKCQDFMATQLPLSFLARSTVKVRYRNATLKGLVSAREVDTKMFIDYVFQPKVQAGLEMYLNSLKKKSK